MLMTKAHAILFVQKSGVFGEFRKVGWYMMNFMKTHRRMVKNEKSSSLLLLFKWYIYNKKDLFLLFQAWCYLL